MAAIDNRVGPLLTKLGASAPTLCCALARRLRSTIAKRSSQGETPYAIAKALKVDWHTVARRELARSVMGVFARVAPRAYSGVARLNSIATSSVCNTYIAVGNRQFDITHNVPCSAMRTSKADVMAKLAAHRCHYMRFDLIKRVI